MADQSSESLSPVKFELDGNKFLSIRLSPQTFVANARKEIGKRRSLENGQLFIDKEGYPIGLMDETSTRLEELMLDNNVVKMQTQTSTGI
ncbi:unnamed protein product [Rotaria socialis]|uniref:Uncharacterized protein n=1 Tax=Rotaria socialis TaxID=392032 RepID=A0A821SCB4_9BILA|nr:unnamed protein product [Rotaria socialis]CAF4854171.1 unnamed protein product [Rotaria socialis]